MLTPDMFKRHGDTQRQGTPEGPVSTEGQGQQPRPRIGRRSGGVASLNETVVKKVSQIFQYNYGIENAQRLERIMKQNGLGETPSDLYEKIRSLTQQQIQTFNGKMDNIDDFLSCLESLKC